MSTKSDVSGIEARRLRIAQAFAGSLLNHHDLNHICTSKTYAASFVMKMHSVSLLSPGKKAF